MRHSTWFQHQLEELAKTSCMTPQPVHMVLLAWTGSKKLLSKGLLLVQEARFDRHFVRDLTWSRHQLEELAERRFLAAQRATLHNSTAEGAHGYNGGPSPDTLDKSFTDLFKKVCA